MGVLEELKWGALSEAWSMVMRRLTLLMLAIGLMTTPMVSADDAPVRVGGLYGGTVDCFGNEDVAICDEEDTEVCIDAGLATACSPDLLCKQEVPSFFGLPLGYELSYRVIGVDPEVWKGIGNYDPYGYYVNPTCAPQSA